MTPEGKVKKRFKDFCKKSGIYYYMPVSNGMGAPALDFICCYKGNFFSVETKAGNKKMTPRQSIVANEITNAGGQAILLNEDERTWEVFEFWLLTLASE